MLILLFYFKHKEFFTFLYLDPWGLSFINPLYEYLFGGLEINHLWFENSIYNRNFHQSKKKYRNSICKFQVKEFWITECKGSLKLAS